jgi:hypothetical protein
MNERFSKPEKRLLRDLAAEAHESELSEALGELYEEFTKWADNGLGAFEMNEKIHEFHNGVSRELYKQYVLNDPHFAVAAGLSRKVLAHSQVAPELLEKLRPLLEAFED